MTKRETRTLNQQVPTPVLAELSKQAMLAGVERCQFINDILAKYVQGKLKA